MDDFTPILAKYPVGAPENLIPILQEIQDSSDYLNEKAIQAVSAHLGIPSVKIYSVATFYNEFRFNPGGHYHIKVCQGTGCLVDGSEQIRRELTRLLEIGPGEITRDGWFSLEWVPCLGVCQEAPVISVNGRIVTRMTPARVKEVITQFRKSR
ncbi:MAG: NAD(P)H-dependent oxidoreductase subunit E [Bacteroidales bacterium]